MRRPVILFALAATALCLVVIFTWTSFISAVNNRQALVTVWVSGAVDEVTIYRVEDSADPLYTIATHGEDTVRAVELPAARGTSALIQMPPAQYLFTARKGNQEYQSTPFCCRAGFLPEQITLTIHSLDVWEVTGSLNGAWQAFLALPPLYPYRGL